MKTTKIITTAALVIGGWFVNNTFAQNGSVKTGNDNSFALNQSSYWTAIGLRAGETSGLTFKHFFTSTNAGEAIIGIWQRGLSFTGLYEKHADAGLNGLNWYYGGGGHLAMNTGRIYYVSEGTRYYRTETALGIGVDGVLGLEYKIPPIPFAVSFDLKPFLEVNTLGHAFMSLDPGLGIKVTF